MPRSLPSCWPPIDIRLPLTVGNTIRNTTGLQGKFGSSTLRSVHRALGSGGLTTELATLRHATLRSSELTALGLATFRTELAGLRLAVLRGELLTGLTELATLGHTTLATELTTLRLTLRLAHLALRWSETLGSGEVLALGSEAVSLRQVALLAELSTLGHATLSE